MNALDARPTAPDVRVRALLIVSTILAPLAFAVWAYFGLIVIAFSDTLESAARVDQTMFLFGILLLSLPVSIVLTWLFYRQRRHKLAVGFALWPVLLTVLPAYTLIGEGLLR